MTWSAPPDIAEEKSDSATYVHPIDHGRLMDYHDVMFKILKDDAQTIFKEDAIQVGELLDNQLAVIKQLLIPNPECPPNYMRIVGDSTFLEFPLAKFYLGLEDRKFVYQDLRKMRLILLTALKTKE